MKKIFVLLFLILSANLIAEEPQTQTQATPGLTIQTADSKHFYNEEDFPSGTFAASSVGATGTPTFFINGRKLIGALPLAAFKNVINDELNRANQMIEKGIELDADFYKKIVQENEKMDSEPSSR